MKGKSVLKRLLSLTLCAAMVATMLPAQTAWAKGDMPDAQAGSGGDAPAAYAEGSESAWPKRLAYFTFDENATDGGNAVAATTGNNISINTEDKRSGTGALKLGGGSYLTVMSEHVAGDNLLNGRKELTLSYWSKAESNGHGWAWYASTGDGWRSDNYIGIMDKPGNVMVERYKDGRGTPPSHSINRTDVGNADAWRHVTIVFEENRTSMYINGALLEAKEGARALTDILNDGSRLHIGKAN